MSGESGGLSLLRPHVDYGEGRVVDAQFLHLAGGLKVGQRWE